MPEGSPDVFGRIVGLRRLESTDEEYPTSDGSKVNGNAFGGDVPIDSIAECPLENNLGEPAVQVHGDQGRLAERSSILHVSPSSASSIQEPMISRPRRVRKLA